MLKRIFLALFVLSSFTQAQVNLTATLPSIDMTIDGKKIHISRIQNVNHKLRNEYTLTSRIAPPFEVQPYTVIKGVSTISELDVFDFIQHQLPKGALLVDARISNWYNKSTIPASTNIPFTIFATDKTIETLSTLGVTHKNNTFNFSQAKELLIFDNGPWCPQASREIHFLVNLGYPKEKILYYRGGMQYWSILGLSLDHPKEYKTIHEGEL
jgi:hypothetical protein